MALFHLSRIAPRMARLRRTPMSFSLMRTVAVALSAGLLKSLQKKMMRTHGLYPSFLLFFIFAFILCLFLYGFPSQMSEASFIGSLPNVLEILAKCATAFLSFVLKIYRKCKKGWRTIQIQKFRLTDREISCLVEKYKNK